MVLVHGMSVGITECWYNRGPTGKQMNTGKNCFSYREYVCSVRYEPIYSPGGLQLPLEAFDPLLVRLVESNSPENGQNAHFLTFHA